MYYGERFNAYSHLLGMILAIVGMVFLLIKATQGNAYQVVSATIYGTSLIILYLGSTLYHSIGHSVTKRILQKIDHCAIYLLIAGSYTPFTLVSLNGAWGWSLFGISWGLALMGIVQELFLPQKNRRLSLLIYILMGWLALVAIKPLVSALSISALFWLVLGGIFYSVGIYWFINDEKIRHAHGIWHLFVIAGSLCQFASIYYWVV